MHPNVRAAGGLVALAAFLLAGCGAGGPTRYTPTGKLTYNGQPMQVKPQVGKLRMWFVQQDAQGPVDLKYAIVEPDGRFRVPPENGLVAGKYKVCVVWQDEFPMGPDKLKGAFDEANSKLFVQVPTEKDLEIDVGRPKG